MRNQKKSFSHPLSTKLIFQRWKLLGKVFLLKNFFSCRIILLRTQNYYLGCPLTNISNRALWTLNLSYLSLVLLLCLIFPIHYILVYRKVDRCGLFNNGGLRFSVLSSPVVKSQIHGSGSTTSIVGLKLREKTCRKRSAVVLL